MGASLPPPPSNEDLTPTEWHKSIQRASEGPFTGRHPCEFEVMADRAARMHLRLEALKNLQAKPDAIITLELGMNAIDAGVLLNGSDDQILVSDSGGLKWTTTSCGGGSLSSSEIKEIVRDEVEHIEPRQWNPEKWKKEEEQPECRHIFLRSLFWASQVAMFGLAAWQLWRSLM